MVTCAGFDTRIIVGEATSYL